MDKSAKWPRAVPTEAKPGETGTCAWCGNQFEQQAQGVTAGNYCAVCWELRNVRIRDGIDRMNKWEKRKPYYVASILVIIGILVFQPWKWFGGSEDAEYEPTLNAQATYLDNLASIDPIWASALAEPRDPDVEQMLLKSGIDACTWFEDGGTANSWDAYLRQESDTGADVAIVAAAVVTLCPELKASAFPND